MLLHYRSLVESQYCKNCGRSLEDHAVYERQFCEKRMKSKEILHDSKSNDDLTLDLLKIEDPVTLDYCIAMDPFRFEELLAKLFVRMGYDAMVTKGSGDQGADLVLQKENKKIVIQVKRQASKVSNDAVQEVIGAIKFYDANAGMVIITSEFQKSAKDLAKVNYIQLVDGTKLEKWLQEFPIPKPQTISPLDIKPDDIYKKNPDFLAIIKKILPQILQMDSHTGYTINYIEGKLAAELLSPPDLKNCKTKILQLLKNEYHIDLEKILQNESVPISDVKKPDEVSKMQLFMDVIRSLEGEHKHPVEESQLIDELVKTEKFTEDEARSYIRKMQKDSVIYEAFNQPGYYNIV